MQQQGKKKLPLQRERNWPPPRRGGKSYFFGFFFRFGAFAVAAGTIAAATALPAAVLADEQDRQCQQHKNNHNNDNTCHIVYYLMPYLWGAFRRSSHQAEHRSYTVYHKCHDPCNTALHQNDACCGAGTAQLTLDGSNRSHAGRVQQGKHQNTMPVNGVNSVVSAAVSPPRRTVSVETTLSLAVKPVISAVKRASHKKPSGLNRGAIKLPMAASRLFVRRSSHVQAHVKVCRNQISTVATKIMVKAFCKSRGPSPKSATQTLPRENGSWAAP